MADDNEELEIEEEKKGGNKLIIMIAAAVLLLGIGGGAAFFFIGGDSDGEVPAEAAEPEVVQTIYYRLEKPFIVNFQAKSKQRYLQVDVTFKGKDQAAMDAIKTHEPVVKNNLNQLFSSQELAVIQTDVGRQALVAEATRVVQEFLQKEIGSEGIEQVLFTNFVMQ